MSKKLIEALQEEFPGTECTILFKRDPHTGQLFITPILADADKLTVPILIERLTEYANATAYMAKDMSTKMALKDRKN